MNIFLEVDGKEIGIITEMSVSDNRTINKIPLMVIKTAEAKDNHEEEFKKDLEAIAMSGRMHDAKKTYEKWKNKIKKVL